MLLSKTKRSVLVLCLTYSLSGCQSSGILGQGAPLNVAFGEHRSMVVSSVAPSRTSSTGMQLSAGDPCKTDGYWYFAGPCERRSVTFPTREVSFGLPRYKAITTDIVQWTVDAPSMGPSRDKSGTIPFIVGEATGDGDIGGTVGGVNFPRYGTHCANMVNGSLVPGACEGKLLLYFFEHNAGKSAALLNESPQISVANAEIRRNETCGLDLLVPVSHRTYEWALASDVGAWGQATQDGRITVNATSELAINFSPKGIVFYAITCM
jgi:hypothetical protein